MSVCPFCGFEAPSIRAELEHMSERHQDEIDRRLREAGLDPEQERARGEGEPIEECPTCGGAVHTVSSDEGTSYYVPIMATQAGRLRQAFVLREALLFAEQMRRNRDREIRTYGEDLLQILTNR